ncbi:FUSC family protein [Azorhizobium caulinodans]|uniref:FUSC family protein n=1 Tax=Azorhizobium caulinodans TaxID=7 RepID=UPI002FBD45B4
MSADSEIRSIAERPARRDARAAVAALLPLVPRLLFGLRLAASVCLALYVTYYLELPNPFWAATTAAIVCQPNLGASLQKGRFRAVGTAIGALALVCLLALFPQQRIALLLCLALWCGLCGFAVVLLRNSAAYAAGLSGITAAILFADSISDPTSAFFLGITRVSEICIGILAAAAVLLITDPGTARLALASLMERIAQQLRTGFLDTLATEGETPDMQAARRNVVKTLTPLHIAIDAATGESGSLYARRGNFRIAIASLIDALVGWRNVSHHPFPDGSDAPSIQQALAARISRINPAAAERYGSDADAVRDIIAEIETQRPESAKDVLSARLLVDAAHKVAICLAQFMQAITLLRTGAGGRLPPQSQPLVIADSLPAWLAGARAFLSVVTVALFWVASAWPTGPFAIAFAVISTLIFASFAEEARARAADYTIGVAVMSVLGSVIYFYVLPTLSTFPALMGLLFLLYVPLGMMQVGTWHSVLFLAMSISSLPLLGIGNPVAYDPAGYFNIALAILTGSAVGTLFFVILPPLGPERRARRLISLSARDLRRLLLDQDRHDERHWRALLSRRLESIPAQATLEQHGALLALLAIGHAVHRLRAAVTSGEGARALVTAFTALAEGQPSVALEFLEIVERPIGTDTSSTASNALPVDVQTEMAVLADAIRTNGALLAMLAPGRTPPSGQ